MSDFNDKLSYKIKSELDNSRKSSQQWTASETRTGNTSRPACNFCHQTKQRAEKLPQGWMTPGQTCLRLVLPWNRLPDSPESPRTLEEGLRPTEGKWSVSCGSRGPPGGCDRSGWLSHLCAEDAWAWERLERTVDLAVFCTVPQNSELGFGQVYGQK